MELATLEEIAKTVNLDLKQWGMQCGLLIVYYPLDYCKTLVQIGYEPYPPDNSWFFGSRYLGLPNMFQYVRYIKSVDGFLGCYRGLVPRLCGSTVSSIVYNTLSRQVAVYEESTSTATLGKKPSRVTEEQVQKKQSAVLKPRSISADTDVRTFLKKTALEIVCVTGSTAVAHPFHVICVRTIAQFVGRENVYTSIWKSIGEIYSREGIRGFFSGLAPRLVADVIYISASATVVYLVLKNFGDDSLTNQAGGMAGNMIAGSFSYPFHVVSNTMIVNNSGLAIGSIPYTRKYFGWTDAYDCLRKDKQLKRGATLIGRAYTGPTHMLDGKLRPYGAFFGPVHKPGTPYSITVLKSA